jgi:UV DNA damage endonuclease
VVKLPPVWTGHADFTNPFEFARFMRDADGLAFDVMLEAKAKDISLLKLRPDLLRYAPDVAARFGIYPDALPTLEAEEAALETLHDPVNDPDVDEGTEPSKETRKPATTKKRSPTFAG